jgi:hypothetical protein
MANDCNPYFSDDFVFPRRPQNRPALDHIAYRIGAYPDFVEQMLRGINRAPELQAWTHRAADDPGIALLEGAAILGDILSFYQERYANEAFLRTASWRESIAELVRLTGYRLAPGVGGLATFAFEAKGNAPISIPAGFPVKADLAEMDKPADFQTSAELTAYPHLSRFNLYRPRSYAGSLTANTTTLELQAVAGVSGPVAAEAVQLKAGDRLMLLPAEPAWTGNGGTMTAQKTPQVVKVKAVRQLLDRTLIDLEAPLAETWTAPVSAWRLGRSFRHFGHNAPATYTRTTSSNGKIDGATEYNTNYLRSISPSGYSYGYIAGVSATRINPFIDAELLALDQEVKDLLPNSQVIVQCRVLDSVQQIKDLSVLRTVEASRADSLGFAAVTGSSSVLTLDVPLVRSARVITTVTSSGMIFFQNFTFSTDIREIQINEVTSPALSLVPQAHDATNGAAFIDGNNALCFFGTQAEAQTLAGRRVLLADAAGRLADLVNTNLATDFNLAAGQHQPRLWTLSFDAPPSPFTRADFDEAAPSVTVYGNLADASQGKAETETVLGNGDARLRFQTFKLPKAPLTWLLSAGATPPQVPELEVRVNGRLWTQVDSLYGRDATEQVYLVRQDAEDRSYIQFGDGETGARLPSGIKNVSADWRTGIGAFGAIKTGATPSAGSKVQGLDKLHLPGPVSGGAQPEAESNARRAAPGKVQGLGRLVSLADYESEVLAIPGVVTAAAVWDLKDGVPGLSLKLLLAAGREAEFEAVRATVQAWQKCRGPDRFPVAVEQAFLRYLWLDVNYAGDPALARTDLENAMHAALGLAGDQAHETTGLFGLARRRLGEKEYASRIEGVLQGVPGVIWCKVTALGLFPPNDPALPGDDDPASLALPVAPRGLLGSVTPSNREMLQLAASHLTLTAVAVPVGACS